ncbi:MAG: 50S ribosomal protein L9 [Phycisphaerae bacterium]
MVELLLLKDVRKLGHVGDVVEVKPGFARNFLLPQRIATHPTPENLKAIEEVKKKAAAERAQRLQEFSRVAESLKDVQITIEAAANEDGTLYGSVGTKEIAAALHKEGHSVRAEHIMLDKPIRSLDTRMVKIEFTDELSAQVKLWVVREGGAADAQSGQSGSTQPAAAAEKSE